LPYGKAGLMSLLLSQIFNTIRFALPIACQPSSLDEKKDKNAMKQKFFLLKILNLYHKSDDNFFGRKISFEFRNWQETIIHQSSIIIAFSRLGK
jgi:hypothetical protein